jgi:hypothetical protein
VSTAAELVLLVAPADPTGQAVRGVLADWARAELVRPCYWLAPQDTPTGEVDACRIDTDGQTPVRLPEDLGDVAWARCRLVLVQPLAPGHPGDPATARFAARYAEFLARVVLPMGTPVTRVNLLVPTTDAPEVPGEVLVPGWEHTFVASPEERASSAHPNVLVTEERNLVGHAALAAASAAGLWIGMDATALDEFVPESASGEPAPRILRAFVRTVRGGDVAHSLADTVLAPREGRWPVPVSERHPVSAASDPRALVEEAVRDLEAIDHGALCYESPPPGVVPRRARVGFRYVWEVFKEFWLILLRRIRDVPARLRRSAEERISRRLFGPDGGHEFGFGVDGVRDGAVKVIELVEEEAADDSLFGQARLAERALALLSREQRPAATTPQAWLELRRLCLGLVDAGPLPEAMEEPIEGAARQVIVEPARLVPNSEAPRFVLPADVAADHPRLRPYRDLVLPPCDPLLTARLDRDLDEVRAELAEERDEQAALARQKTAEAATLRQQLVTPGAHVPSPELVEAEIRRAEAEADAASERQRRLQARVERLEEVIEELRAWAAPRLETLLWRVGETIGRHLDRATIDQREALEALRELPELDTEVIERGRKRVVRTLVFWFLAAVVGSVLAIVFADLVWAPLVALVVFLVVTVRAFLRYSRLRSSVEWRFAEATARQRNALNALVHVAREVSRLAMVYRLFVEWAEILGYQAHRPWVPDEASSTRPDPAPIPPESLPSSLVVGVGEVADETRAVLVGQVSRRIHHEGWLAEQYRVHREHSTGRLAARLGVAADDLDPDHDGLTSGTGARTFLRDDLRDHLPQKASFARALGEIREFCQSLEPEALFEEITLPDGSREPVEEFLGRLVPEPGKPVPGFPVDLLRSEARVGGAYDDVTVRLWVPAGIGEGGGGPGADEVAGGAAGALPGADADATAGRISIVQRPAATTRSGHYLLQAVRLDLSPPIEPGAFALFPRDPATARPVEPAGAGTGGDGSGW